MARQSVQSREQDFKSEAPDFVRVPWFVQSRFVITVALALTVTIGALIVLYWRTKKPETDGIEFTTKTLVGVAAIVSLIVAFQSLLLRIYSDKVKASFEFLARFDKQEERTARRLVESLILRTGSLEQYQDDLIPVERILGIKSSLTPQERDAAYAFLAYVEDIALAIRSGYVHEAVLCRSLRPTLVRLLRDLRPFVVITQLEEKDANYFEEAMQLWEHWRRGRQYVSFGTSGAPAIKNWMYLAYASEDFERKLSAVSNERNERVRLKQ